MAVVTETGERVFGVTPFFDETAALIFTSYKPTSLTETGRVVFGLTAEETGAEEIRKKKRGTRPPWFRAGGRGYFTLISGPRVGVVLHAPPPIRRRRRVAPLPRGRARRPGTLTRAPASIARVLLFRKVRSPRRRLPKSRFWRVSAVPGTAPAIVMVAPQGRTFATRRKKIESRQSGKAIPFGWLPRFGVTTRPAALNKVRKMRRIARLPRGRLRRLGKFGTPLPTRAAPLNALRRRRELQTLPRGRARPFSRPQRVGPATRPAPPERIAARKRGTAAPAKKVKTKVKRFQPAQPPPFKLTTEATELTAETLDKQKIKSGGGQSS